MNVKFRILWFEDTPTWLETEKENVEDLLKAHCLVPEIECYDGDEICEEKITDSKYDLILMDYKLAEEKNGDDIARTIRSHKVLTDILLYSTYTEELYEAIRRGVPDLDGIYIAKRDTKTFKDKVAGIIEKIIKRSEDIVNLRGFVLDNTSDFETRIAQMLSVCYKRFENDNKEKLKSQLEHAIRGNMENGFSKLDEYINNENAFDLINGDHMLTNISTRLSVFQIAIKILKTEFSMPDDYCSNKFCEYYMNNVGVYRNKLGHVKADDSQIVVAGKTEPIDEELHKKLRKNVTEVDKTIKRLEEYINQISAR